MPGEGAARPRRAAAAAERAPIATRWRPRGSAGWSSKTLGRVGAAPAATPAGGLPRRRTSPCTEWAATARMRPGSGPAHGGASWRLRSSVWRSALLALDWRVATSIVPRDVATRLDDAADHAPGANGLQHGAHRVGALLPGEFAAADLRLCRRAGRAAPGSVSRRSSWSTSRSWSSTRRPVTPSTIESVKPPEDR